MSKKIRILLISGHGAGDPGACSAFGIEANEAVRVVNEVKRQFGVYDVSVDVYPMDRNAYVDLKNGKLAIDIKGYDYVFEVHFNSSSNSGATGVEIWVVPEEKGITVEQAICNKISALGYLNRGVKREYFSVINYAKNKCGVSAALVETCFISNRDDMTKYNKEFFNVCKAMVDGIAEGFGINKNGNVDLVPAKPIQQPTEKPKVAYFVKTSAGKQLGAFNNLEYAKNMAKSNKAIVYDANSTVIVSYVVATTPKPPAQSVASDKEIRRYGERGKCTVTVSSGIKFRNKPTTDNGSVVTGSYGKGEAVYYDLVVISEKYVWISWLSASTGERRYMHITDRKKNEKWAYCV